MSAQQIELDAYEQGCADGWASRQDAIDARDSDDCEACGEYIGPGPGYPRRCAGCEEMSRPSPLRGDGKKHACPDCGKRFRKEIAVAAHRRDVHAQAGEAGTAETRSGSVHEHAVRAANAPTNPPQE